jgi:hypothetical protein
MRGEAYRLLNSLFEPHELDGEQKFVILRDQTAMGRIQPDDVRPLKPLPNAFHPPENYTEDVLPVFGLADQPHIIREVDILDQRPLFRPILLRFVSLPTVPKSRV